ncbi:MAG: glycosyltransferase, partial [Cyanobacteria bacterium]|nr:glycosyltransferase [Cyanobacteriota bacterium]MDW8202882.1 glycosyltransferase [Cyanobacteriota bacterium SKYGB_h_bin112]
GQILQSYAEKDHRIKLINRNDNRGIVATLNEGLSYVTGRYVSQVDGDDIAMPEMLATQFVYLENHPECVAVGQRVLMIDADDAPIRVFNNLMTHEEIDAAHMKGLGAFSHSGSMVRRDAMERVGGYRQEMELAEDMDLWLRLAEIGRLANLPNVLFKYRLHSKSVSYSKRVSQLKATRAVVIDAHRRRGLPLPEGMKNDPDITEKDLPTLAGNHRVWAWWALGDGYVDTARKHALCALTKEPLTWDSWKVTLCALRGW